MLNLYIHVVDSSGMKIRPKGGKSTYKHMYKTTLNGRVPARTSNRCQFGQLTIIIIIIMSSHIHWIRRGAINQYVPAR